MSCCRVKLLDFGVVDSRCSMMVFRRSGRVQCCSQRSSDASSRPFQALACGVKHCIGTMWPLVFNIQRGYALHSISDSHGNFYHHKDVRHVVVYIQ